MSQRSHLIAEVFGERPHPLAGVRGQDLLDRLQINTDPANIVVLLKTHNLISGSLQGR